MTPGLKMFLVLAANFLAGLFMVALGGPGILWFSPVYIGLSIFIAYKVCYKEQGNYPVIISGGLSALLVIIKLLTDV